MSEPSQPLKIFYLVPQSPATFNMGVCMRCRFIADTLHSCSQLCVWVLGHTVTDADATWRKPAWEHREFDKLTCDALSDKILRLLRLVLLRAPVFSDGFINRSRLKSIIDKLISFQPDVVILGYSHLGILEPLVRKYAPTARIVLDAHNVECLIYQRFAANAATLVEKIKNRLLARRMRSLERLLAASCDEIWAVSEADARFFSDYGAGKIQVIPNTIPLEAYRPLPLMADRTISFIGPYTYLANEQAAMFLIDCSHELMSRGVNHTLTLIGSNPTQRMISRAAGAVYINIKGEVASAAEELLKSDILAAPIFTGGGTKFKIIEALALGRAVVTTPTGNEGLHLQHGRDALIVDGERFGEALTHLLQNPEVARTLGENGRVWFEHHLSSEKIRGTIVERVIAWSGTES